MSASIIISVVLNKSIRTFAKASRIWRSCSASAPPYSESKSSSSIGQSATVKGSVRSAIAARRSNGFTAGLSASAKAAESISTGIEFWAKARAIALTSAPGLRKITAIFDQGIPSCKWAALKTFAMYCADSLLDRNFATSTSRAVIFFLSVSLGNSLRMRRAGEPLRKDRATSLSTNWISAGARKF